MYLGYNNPKFAYTLQGCALASTPTVRDLGVTVSEDCSVSQQCTNVAARARRLTGLMLRTFTSRRRTVILPMFKSIIRPLVEYATPVWNPHLKKDIAEIEQVQRKITKCNTGLSHLTYEKRLLSLDLPKLDTCRRYFDLIECYKILHGLTRSDCHAFVSLSQLHTRGYRCKLKAVSEPARLDVYVDISLWSELLRSGMLCLLKLLNSKIITTLNCCFAST